MKPFTAKHCTPISYGSPLKQEEAASNKKKASKPKPTNTTSTNFTSTKEARAAGRSYPRNLDGNLPVRRFKKEQK